MYLEFWNAVILKIVIFIISGGQNMILAII